MSISTSDPLTTSFPVRVTLFGNFSKGWAARFAYNGSLCDQGKVFIGGISNGNSSTSSVSNTARWTVDDGPTLWSMQFVFTSAAENVMLCWSSDDGATWSIGKTKEHAQTFRVWKKVPTAVAVPQTVTSGQLMRVLVMQPLGKNVKGVLVRNATSCSGLSPRGPVSAFAKYSGEGFAFKLPNRMTGTVYLCVSLPPYLTWSLIPFDPRNDLVFAQGHERVPKGKYPEVAGISVFPASVRGRRARIVCTPMIAGAHVTCTMSLFNRTALQISPATIRISTLTDGTGRVECPLPSLKVVNATSVSFTFTPQFSGREGSLSLSYLSLPVLMEDNGPTTEYYSALRSIADVVPWYTRDSSLYRFSVQPAFSALQQFNNTNLVSWSGFNRTADWPLQDGVYRFFGSQNGTANGDMTATFFNKSGSQSIAQTATISPFSERCRFVVHYYFFGQAMNHETSVRVGSVTVLSGALTLRSFTLYNYLKQIVVVGDGLRPNGINGDVYTLEQIVAEIAILSSYKTLTILLSVDNSQSRQLYFLNPELTCSMSSTTARTDSHDVAALQRIFKSVGLSSRLRNWIKPSGEFNGDPCTNGWEGVLCRHMRVVALDLKSVGLAGEFPAVRELTMLESIDLRFNSLAGHFAVNNSRLVNVDVSHNLISTLSFANGAFPFASHKCLRYLTASSNRISTFPSSVTGLSQLVELDLSLNQMKSTVPQDFSLMTSLKVVHLQTNNLYGQLPSNFALFALVSLDFSNNRFSGTIPATWGAFKNILSIDVSKNVLNGTIPWELGAIPTANRMVFRAEDNFLTGFVPRLGSKLLDLRNNYFECPLMRPELDTGVSEMSSIVMWGVNDWCDFKTAPPGY